MPTRIMLLPIGSFYTFFSFVQKYIMLLPTISNLLYQFFHLLSKVLKFKVTSISSYVVTTNRIKKYVVQKIN